MLIRFQKIVLVNARKPSHASLNQDLQWFGSSLGLFGLRDKDKSCFRIFIELLKAAKLKEPLTSDEIAAKLGLSRGTVVHHLHKLMDAGIIIPHKNRYLLRVDNLEDLVEEIKKDALRAIEDLSKVASEIDKVLGL